MNIAFNSRQILHLSVTPSIKSWSILFGILSIGIGAAYYCPDEHPLMKLAYLSGCFFLGLTFLSDWEDCVVDQIQKKITLTRRNWFEYLTSRCPPSKTLVLDTSSVMEVQVLPVKKYFHGRCSEELKQIILPMRILFVDLDFHQLLMTTWSRNHFKVSLLLRSGSIVPVSETSSSIKSDEEAIGKCIRRILCLDRIETVRDLWNDSDDDNQSVVTVTDIESLERNPFFKQNDLKENNENPYHNALNDESDSNSNSQGSSSSDGEYEDW